MWGLATSTRVKDFLASWNISVHNWLKYYVYLRLLDEKKKGGTNAFAALMSFLVSAIWHGFYPGFYSFFLGAFVLDLWNKLAANCVGGTFDFLPASIRNVMLTTFYYIGCSYFAIGFMLLNWCDFHPVYMSMGYFFHVFLLTTLPILIMLQPRSKPKDQSIKKTQ